MNGDNTSHYWLEDDGRDELKTENKPPYRVPLMSEIEALLSNGYSVVSTFAGGGGSSTGYRMAGCNVLWANEFLPKAQKTYSANHPSTILDTRSVHNLTAKDILKATGLKKGELDIFDGSPPCQSFSTAGQRERGWEKLRDYGDGIKQRNDDLFFEYARLLKGLQPKVFVAENVSGLVKGTAKGYFKTILATLKRCGYTVEAKLLDAQWLGVPQMRQRIIFMGAREDLKLSPVYPSPLSYRYSVRDAIGYGALNKSYSRNRWSASSSPHTSIMTAPMEILVEHDESGDRSQGVITDRVSPNGRADRAATHFVTEIEGANGYNSHAEIKLSARNGGQIARHPIDVAGPCSTIRSGDTSFEVEGSERRKLSIPELKRICGFPDDYILEGSYADQWFVCGNAVPPVMMAAIATSIRDGILNKLPA